MALRLADLLASIAFAGYAWNVLAGKAEILFGISLPRATDVVEFVLLLVASAAFISGTIQRERERSRQADQQASSEQGATG